MGTAKAGGGTTKKGVKSKRPAGTGLSGE